mgnify:FL=1
MPKSKYKKRKDGRFQTSIVVDGVKKYVIANTSEELDNKITEINYKKLKGLSLSFSDITFKQYAEKWFDINISTKEIATQNSVKNRLKHIYQYIGNVKLKNLKRYQIQEIQTAMLKDGYTDITNRTIAECKRILEDAVNNDIIEKNVANGIKAKKFPKTERKPLTQYEDLKVLECAKNNKYGIFILILRYCGIRPEEAVALTIKDVDLDNQLLNINKAVSLAQNQPTLKATKNLKNRKIPIPIFLIESLQKEIEYRNKNKIKYLFTKETDKYSMLTKQALKTHLSSFLNALNRNLTENDKKIKFTYYQLRHSYCTMLYYAGVKIKKAQELMGHSSADMVYDIYTHLDEERENATELINDYISSKNLTTFWPLFDHFFLEK